MFAQLEHKVEIECVFVKLFCRYENMKKQCRCWKQIQAICILLVYCLVLLLYIYYHKEFFKLHSLVTTIQ